MSTEAKGITRCGDSMSFLDAILNGHEEAMHYAVFLYEQAEKYAWHDLRKNPDDLPNEGTEVLALIDCENGVWHQLCHYENEFYDALTGEYCDEYVRAWRYIEPFDGEVE